MVIFPRLGGCLCYIVAVHLIFLFDCNVRRLEMPCILPDIQTKNYVSFAKDSVCPTSYVLFRIDPSIASAMNTSNENTRNLFCSIYRALNKYKGIDMSSTILSIPLSLSHGRICSILENIMQHVKLDVRKNRTESEW